MKTIGLGLLLYLALPVFAFTGEKLVFLPTSSSKIVASIMNSSSSYGELLDSLSALTTEERAGLKKLLTDSGIKLTDRIPKTKVNGTVISFSGARTKIHYLENGAFEVDGKVFHRSPNDPIDLAIRKFLAAEKKSPIFSSFLLPKAHAEDFDDRVDFGPKAAATAVTLVHGLWGSEEKIFSFQSLEDCKCGDNNLINANIVTQPQDGGQKVSLFTSFYMVNIAGEKIPCPTAPPFTIAKDICDDVNNKLKSQKPNGGLKFDRQPPSKIVDPTR